jgi:hypothetical protein
MKVTIERGYVFLFSAVGRYCSEIENTSLTEGFVCLATSDWQEKALDDGRSIEAAKSRADCLVKPSRMVERDGRFSSTVHRG